MTPSKPYSRSFPHVIDHSKPLVTLRQLEGEIFDIEHIRVVFRGNPNRAVFLSYLARFHVPLESSGAPTVLRFITRLRQLMIDRGEMAQRQHVSAVEILFPAGVVGIKRNGVQTFTSIKACDARLSRSPSWPFSGRDDLNVLRTVVHPAPVAKE